MAGGVVYLCHPQERYVPGIESWAQDAVASKKDSPPWTKWTIRTLQYDHSASIRVNDLCSEVCGHLGPVILIEPVQARVVELLRGRLGTRVAVLRESVHSTDDICEVLEYARELHEAGDPTVCRRYAVALLLLRKLDQQRMWCGNSKGYMYASDIPKGRGLDLKFSDAVPEVISLLFGRALLLQKKKHDGSKYGLNPDLREQIYGVLRERRFPEELGKILERDGQVVSARELDLLDCYSPIPEAANEPAFTGKGKK